MTTELKRTEIAEQRVCGTGFMWWALNEDDDVCEECGCLISGERELEISLCRKCAEESGDWKHEDSEDED
jgi:anaerobic ribonucleoside-triphosphate reductase